MEIIDKPINCVLCKHSLRDAPLAKVQGGGGKKK